jgi:hypothetical protein
MKKDIVSYSGSRTESPFPLKPPKYPSWLAECVLPPNSEGKIQKKNVLSLTRSELKIIRSLLGAEGYDYDPQMWILPETKITLKRRHFLEAIFFEAGVDQYYCEHKKLGWVKPDEYFDSLHNIWHKLSEV